MSQQNTKREKGKRKEGEKKREQGNKNEPAT